MLAIIILAPIVIPIFYLCTILEDFVGFLKSEWQKMGMTQEEAERMHRMILLMHAEHITGRRMTLDEENKNNKGEDNENEK